MKIQDAQETLKLTPKVPPVGETWFASVPSTMSGLRKFRIESVTTKVIEVTEVNINRRHSWLSYYKISDVEFIERVEEPESKLYSI